VTFEQALRIERARDEHVAVLARIAEECGLSVDFPAELAKRHALLLVALSGDVVHGFLLAWRAVDELHLTDLGVTEGSRRRGAARCLVRALSALGKSTGAVVILLEVRASNAAARALYSALGCREVGTRARYYADTGEDAVVMRLELS